MSGLRLAIISVVLHVIIGLGLWMLEGDKTPPSDREPADRKQTVTIWQAPPVADRPDKAPRRPQPLATTPPPARRHASARQPTTSRAIARDANSSIALRQTPVTPNAERGSATRGSATRAGPTDNPTATPRPLRSTFERAFQHSLTPFAAYDLSKIEDKRPRKPSALAPSGGGTYQVDDLVFKGKVDRHGKLSMTDKPNISPYVALPSLSGLRQLLSNWQDNIDSRGGLMDESFNSSGEARQDISKPKDKPGIVPVFGAKFDLTDWVMRSSGLDPYYARKKQTYDDSRAFRQEMALGAQREDLREAVIKLKTKLTRIWTYQQWPAARRKREIFQLWDECVETGPPMIVETARLARITIYAFIRREIPQGSGEEYGVQELRGLNDRRVSTTRFTPYTQASALPPGRPSSSPQEQAP